MLPLTALLFSFQIKNEESCQLHKLKNNLEILSLLGRNHCCFFHDSSRSLRNVSRWKKTRPSVLSTWNSEGWAFWMSELSTEDRPAAVTGGWAHPELGEECWVKVPWATLGMHSNSLPQALTHPENTGWSLRTTPWMTITLETPMERGEWDRTQPERKLPSHLWLTFN